MRLIKKLLWVGSAVSLVLLAVACADRLLESQGGLVEKGVPEVSILEGASADRAVVQTLQDARQLVEEFAQQGYYLVPEGALVAEFDGEVGVLLPFRSRSGSNRSGLLRALIVDGQVSSEAGFIEFDAASETVVASGSLGTLGEVAGCSWGYWWRCVLNQALQSCGGSTRFCQQVWWNPGAFIMCLGGLCGLPVVYYWFWGCCH